MRIETKFRQRIRSFFYIVLCVLISLILLFFEQSLLTFFIFCTFVHIFFYEYYVLTISGENIIVKKIFRKYEFKTTDVLEIKRRDSWPEYKIIIKLKDFRSITLLDPERLEELEAKLLKKE